MSVLYVHIGTPKTGTTALQDFLKNNPVALQEQDAVYPEFPVTFERVSRARNAFWLTKSGYDEKTAAVCFRQINNLAGTYSTILLSDEVLFNSIAYQTDFWENVRKNLDDRITIRAVVYLRRQDLYVNSWWAQQVKATNHYSFDGYTFQEYLASDAYPNLARHLDYQNYLQAAIGVLGRENVLVRVFERGQFTGGDLYLDYLDTVGLKRTASFVVPDNLTNISIKGSVLEVKRLLNHFPEFAEKRNNLIPYMEKAQLQMEKDGTLTVKNDFPQEQRIAFMKQYEASNEWVARNMLDREDGVLFHEPIKPDRGETGNYSMQEIVDACGYMMLEMLEAQRKNLREAERLKMIQNSRSYQISEAVAKPIRKILRSCRKSDG